MHCNNQRGYVLPLSSKTIVHKPERWSLEPSFIYSIFKKNIICRHLTSTASNNSILFFLDLACSNEIRYHYLSQPTKKYIKIKSSVRGIL